MHQLLLLVERQSGFDLAFLGYSVRRDTYDSGSGARHATTFQDMRWARYRGGTFAYFLSGRGARKLTELVERDGVQQRIDYFVYGHRPELVVLEADPPLVDSSVVETWNDVDSDVQRDDESIAFEVRGSTCG